MDEYTLVQKENEYIYLYNNVVRTMNYMIDAYNGMNDCSLLGSYYSINGASADNNTVANIRDNLYQLIMALQEQVLPWLENKYKELDRQRLAAING